MGVLFQSRPAELVVEIFLPEMSSAKTVDLDVEEGKLSLLSTDPVRYMITRIICRLYFIHFYLKDILTIKWSLLSRLLLALTTNA